jgi:glutamyl-tRNA synthetase
MIFSWVDDLVLEDFISDSLEETLDWEEELRAKVKKYAPKWKEDRDYFEKILPLFHERLMYLGELPDLTNFFYDEELDHNIEDLKSFGEGDRAGALKELWEDISSMFEDDWDHDKWEQAVRDRADSLGWKHGQLFMLLRVAVTGRKASPPLFDCLKLLGEDKCKNFISQAVEVLE